MRLGSLCSVFPHLFHLSSLKDIVVFNFFGLDRELYFLFIWVLVTPWPIEKRWMGLLSWLCSGRLSVGLGERIFVCGVQPFGGILLQFLFS